MLRDQIVCGINNEQTQKRLLAEPDLTYKKAVELVQALEMAESNAKQLAQSPSEPTKRTPVSTPVHKTTPHPPV